MRLVREDVEGVTGSTGAPAGEMRERVRLFDWAATPLGPRERWSASLEWAVELILSSGFPMGVRWGPEFTMIYNDACASLIGDKHPGALGRSLAESWPEINEQLGPICAAILRGERPGFFAEDHPWSLRRHGMLEESRFTISYSPIPDPTAKSGIGGILITSFETTERVRNERVLRVLTSQLEAEVQQRTRERDRVWQVSEDLLGVSNFDGYFVSINPAWTRLLGWSEEEIKALHVRMLRHPDDAPRSEAGRARLAQGVQTVRMENRFRHRDGSWRWISWTMTADDGLIYVAGRHVTEEKKAAEALRTSERQFRALISGVTDYAFIMLDPTGIVASWNTGAQRIKGYTAEEIIGRHFSQFYTEEDRAAGLPQRSIAIATETGKFEAEAWRMRKDGSRFFANVVIDAVRDENGKLIGFAKITRDVTERRNAQETLERTQRQLAQSQKMEALGQLTGGVAHDFNNLLMVVGGQAQALLRRATDPKDVRALEAVRAAASRGEALTRQLLTFARRQPINPETVCPARTIAAFRNVLESSVPSSISLTLDIPDSISAIGVDVAEFELALVNLVVNARDAMPEGGTIKLSARNVTLNGDETDDQVAGDFVALTLTDTGTGIPEEVRAKVFEPFFTTKTPDKGTGLGLSQVYGFVRQSRGGISIASDVGRGTAVTLYLPVSHEPVAVKGAAPAPISQSNGRGELILVVEDNPEVKTVAIALLEQLNYRTRAAENAHEALELLDADRVVDLVFTDVMLPGGLNGVEFAAIVRDRFPEIPVLLTSGYAKALHGPHGLPILRKPYQIEALAQAVRSALERGRRTAHP